MPSTRPQLYARLRPLQRLHATTHSLQLQLQLRSILLSMRCLSHLLPFQLRPQLLLHPVGDELPLHLLGHLEGPLGRLSHRGSGGKSGRSLQLLQLLLNHLLRLLQLLRLLRFQHLLLLLSLLLHRSLSQIQFLAPSRLHSLLSHSLHRLLHSGRLESHLSTFLTLTVKTSSTASKRCTLLVLLLVLTPGHSSRLWHAQMQRSG